MKKINIISLLLIAAIAFTLIFPLKAICEDQESSSDILLCKADIAFEYLDLFVNGFSYSGRLYSTNQPAVFLDKIISYLERQVKSPPEVTTA